MTTQPQEATEKASGQAEPVPAPALPAPDACCAPAQETSCCEPAAKAACCGDSHVKGCGCK